MIDGRFQVGQTFTLNLMAIFAAGLVSMLLLVPGAVAQQKPAFPSDPSRVTDAPESCSGTGKMEAGQQRYTLRIPIGDRLDEVFASSSNWITGITFRLADAKDRGWGHWDGYHEHTHTLKDKEYIVGVRVHTDAQIDWFDLITSQSRVLHFGHPKSGNLGRGTDLLNIPAQSRVTALTLYVTDRKPPAILRIEALFQPVR